MRQETFIERFKRRIKTKRYRCWLLGRTLLCVMTVLAVWLCVALVVQSIKDYRETSAQPTETPVVESTAPEVSPEVPAEPIPETSDPEEVMTEEAIPAEPIPEVQTVKAYSVPLDLELQLFIIQVCEDYHIEPSIVIAMIERETRFDVDAIGDNCHSYGLMQIQQQWHQGRMDKLGVTDLLDPYQNVLVGIDYLAELCGLYEDIEMALMAYNAGCNGAHQYWFSNGIFSNAYSQGVLDRSRTFKEGMVEYAFEIALA